jgi:serine/threonine-protein kinase
MGVRGPDLRARLSQGPLAPRACAELVAAIAAGLEAAHREGILHRDIKPENVLLPEPDGGAKVLDFGVARMIEMADVGRTLTTGGTVVGTPANLAPAHLGGARVDARADVYSLAVVAYEMLTGRLPFGAGSWVDVATRQAQPAAGFDPAGITDAAVDVLRRALSLDREERPSGAAAFATALGLSLDPRGRG